MWWWLQGAEGMAAASLERGWQSRTLEEWSRGKLTHWSVPVCVLHKARAINIGLVVQWLKEFLSAENNSSFSFLHEKMFASFLYGGKGNLSSG